MDQKVLNPNEILKVASKLAEKRNANLLCKHLHLAVKATFGIHQVPISLPRVFK